ncbi:MAG: hypothetical protein KDD35_04105 [Bdellovibrionales bacterium]|nr:hypothetical protein [Bdellovibrionales bacterium]
MRDLGRFFLPPFSDDPNSALILFGLREIWHRIFDPCPLLLDNLADAHSNYFNEFLFFASERKSKMDWTLHLEFISFLTVSQFKLSHDIKIELLTAAASKWCATNRTPHRGLILIGSIIPLRVICAAKSEVPTQPPKLFYGEWENSIDEALVGYKQPTTQRIDFSFPAVRIDSFEKK